MMIVTEKENRENREVLSPSQMKVALIEVKPENKEYVAKEMAGGLGKRLKLKSTFFGSILNRYLNSFFNAPPILLAQVAGLFRRQNYGIDSYYTSSPADISKETNIAIILSSMVDYKNEVHFIKRLKELYPHVKTIVVGSFGSAMPELYKPVADFVIMGDPEIAIQNIITQGFPSQPLIRSEDPENLNELPMLDWTSFLKKGSYAYRPFSKDRGISIQKSRGCSMTCNYCPYAAFYGKAKQFDSQYVLKTIEYYYHNYNIRYFMFRDPNFGENKQDFRVFMKTLLDSKLKISWSCEARLDTFRDDDLKLMHEAGLRYLITGIESSNDELLKENLRVAYKKEDTYRKIGILEERDVIVQSNYIIGFPHETEQSVMDTLEFSKTINTMFATFHIFTPQPGTKVFTDYKDKFLDVDWEEFSYSHLTWKHDVLSKDFLEEALYNAYVQYYFRPRWLLKHFKSLSRLVF